MPLVLVLLSQSSRPAQAVNYNRNTGPGIFRQASLWSPYFPPTSFGPGGFSDTVKFNLSTNPDTPYTVTNVSGENDRMLVGNDSLVLNVDQYSLLNNGSGGPALTMGLAANDLAFVTMTGAASSLLSTGFTELATVSNSTATLYVRNIQWNSSVVELGTRGIATLGIYDGAHVTQSGQLDSGSDPGSSGQIIIDGPGTTYAQNGNLTMGLGGKGYLNVIHGAQLNSIRTVLGDFANSVGYASVTDPDTTWTNSSYLQIGVRGTASLYVNNGGQATTGRTAVGVYSTSSATATVRTPGASWTVTDTLSIGGDSYTGETQGHGTVTVKEDGRISVAGTTTIYPGGVLNLQGGSFQAPAISLQGGAFNWTGGALTVGTYNANLTNASGVLAPGAVTGSTTVAGSYSQLAQGKLAIDIGGTSAGTTYDSVGVSGSAILGGSLELNLANSFAPHAADTFSIFNAVGGVLGVFGNVG
ncbi:MAG: hypothetical protein AB7I57_09430, partial [Pirellulales bacterium]